MDLAARTNCENLKRRKRFITYNA